MHPPQESTSDSAAASRNGSARIRKITTTVGAALAVIVGIYVLRSFKPTDASWYPKCMFYQNTGLHCPGCGATRALWALAYGDVWLAIRNNALRVVGGPIITAVIIRQRRRESAGGLASPKLCIALFVVIGTYFIARNVPSPTSSPLAPPQTKSETAGTKTTESDDETRAPTDHSPTRRRDN